MNEERIHKKSFKSDGHLDENGVAACSEWLHRGSSDIDKEILEHLENCHLCKQQVLEIAEIVEEDYQGLRSQKAYRDKFEETCAAKNSPSIKSFNRGQIWKVAAIFFALITITALSLLIQPNKNKDYADTVEQEDTLMNDKDASTIDSYEIDVDSTKGQESRSIPIIIDKVEDNKFTKNFEPNPGYEALIGAQFRAGDQASINKPSADTTLLKGSTITFLGVNPAESILELQILNNIGQVLKKYEGLDLINLEVTVDFDPGIYYWKLSGEEELIQIGKFSLLETM